MILSAPPRSDLCCEGGAFKNQKQNKTKILNINLGGVGAACIFKHLPRVVLPRVVQTLLVVSLSSWGGLALWLSSWWGPLFPLGGVAAIFALSLFKGWRNQISSRGGGIYFTLIIHSLFQGVGLFLHQGHFLSLSSKGGTSSRGGTNFTGGLSFLLP